MSPPTALALTASTIRALCARMSKLESIILSSLVSTRVSPLPLPCLPSREAALKRDEREEEGDDCAVVPTTIVEFAAVEAELLEGGGGGESSIDSKSIVIGFGV